MDKYEERHLLMLFGCSHAIITDTEPPEVGECSHRKIHDFVWQFPHC